MSQKLCYILFKRLSISSHNRCIFRHDMKVLFKNVTTPLAYTVVTCFNIASLIFFKKLLMEYDISTLKQLAVIPRQTTKAHTVSPEVPSATNLFACTTRKKNKS